MAMPSRLQSDVLRANASEKIGDTNTAVAQLVASARSLASGPATLPQIVAVNSSALPAKPSARDAVVGLTRRSIPLRNRKRRSDAPSGQSPPTRRLFLLPDLSLALARLRALFGGVLPARHADALDETARLACRDGRRALREAA